MYPDIVVLAGGRGTRMGPLAQEYGCKSLISVSGMPALEWLLRALKFAFLDEARIWFNHPLPKKDTWKGARRGSH